MEHPLVIDPAHPLVERVRAICLPYPEAIEFVTHGRPAFKAGKIFVQLSASMDRPHTIVVKADPDERLALLQDPRFFLPPYLGHAGWVATDLDLPTTDWTEIAELIDASYRQIALRRQLMTLDARPDS